jgi:medium-chain acyl-[acyl-carrier-protein] hydrolase
MIASKALRISANQWIVTPKPRPAAPLRLLCFPHAGGSSHAFEGWQKSIHSAEISVLQLPGRGRRFSEPCLTRIEPIVDAAAQCIEHDKPAIFFGHSMGAIIAFEIIRRLRAQNRPLPLRLFVSGASAPSLWAMRPLISTASDADLRKTLEGLDGMADALENEELMEFLLPILRADFSVCDNYCYRVEERIPCDIFAFAGDADDRAPAAEMQPWREETSMSFRSRIFRGGHFFLRANEPELLAILEHDLRQIAAVETMRLARMPACVEVRRPGKALESSTRSR